MTSIVTIGESHRRRDTKRVIFNLSVGTVDMLNTIPSGQRSRFVSEQLERAFRIRRRIHAAERIEALGRSIKVKPVKGGWGDVRKISL